MRSIRIQSPGHVPGFSFGGRRGRAWRDLSRGRASRQAANRARLLHSDALTDRRGIRIKSTLNPAPARQAPSRPYPTPPLRALHRIAAPGGSQEAQRSHTKTPPPSAAGVLVRFRAGDRQVWDVPNQRASVPRSAPDISRSTTRHERRATLVGRTAPMRPVLRDERLSQRERNEFNGRWRRRRLCLRSRRCFL